MADVAASGSDKEEAKPMADVAKSSLDLIVAHEEQPEVVSSSEVGSVDGGPMDTEMADGSGNEVLNLNSIFMHRRNLNSIFMHRRIQIGV
ncbi:hypothetical protein LIER_07142 [Lithospermum erythrorhizon]|uniref:Uncharacterized protein n=1 Tax=Lithospermum erythrorhizon TaxID=34254 RepID=A0AAV3P775_LITER